MATDWSALIAQKKQAGNIPTAKTGTDWSALIAQKKEKDRQPSFELPKETVRRENLAVEGPAPFEAHAVAAASESPDQIVRAYAKHRFPTLTTDDASKRYYMKDDEVWYIDNDGIERKEDRETGLKQAIEEVDPTKIKGRQFAAKALIETPPAVVGAGVGIATENPYLAAGAAGVARGLESTIANLLADRDPQYKEALQAGGVEAISSILGDFIAKRGIKAFDSLRNLVASGEQKIIQKTVGEDIPGLKLPESKEAIREISRVAEENNIPLDMAQLLQSQEAADLQKSILQSGGAGAEILKQHGKETADATEAALSKQLKEISPEMTTRYATGKEAVKTAGAARESLVTARKEASGGLYKQAFKEQQPVETLPVITSIDAAIKNDVARGGQTSKQLTKIRGMLVKDAPENHPAVIEIDKILSTIEGPTKAASNLKEVRKKLTEGSGILEDRLKKLDSAKKEIAGILKNEKLPPEQDVYLSSVIDNLDKQMVKENPIYQEAKKTFAEMSDPINAFDKTILDTIRKLEGDNVIKAPKRMLSADYSDPQTIEVAKNLIKKENPKIWDSITRAFMEQELDMVGDTMSGRGIAEGFRKRLWKPQMKKRLKAALEPDQFKKLDDFMGLVKNLGISIDTNSDTAMKQMATDRRKRLAGGKTGAALRKAGRIIDLLKGNLKEIAEEIETIKDPEFSRKLALAFVSKDKDIIRAVNRLKTVNPKTEKFLRVFARFVSQISGRAGSKELQADDYGSKEDVLKYLENPE